VTAIISRGVDVCKTFAWDYDMKLNSGERGIFLIFLVFIKKLLITHEFFHNLATAVSFRCLLR
jgi:hypothetical protein